MTKDNTELVDQPLTVKVFSPVRVFYSGKAKSVSAVNDTGPFDVLPGHINFFSLLKECTVVVDTGDEKIEVPISHGLVHDRHNQLTLFVFGLA